MYKGYILKDVIKSEKPSKKLTAVFYNKEKNKEKKVHFGAKNMDDFTLTGDKEQRKRYRTRHQKDLKTRDPLRAGFLSYYILWGDSKSRSVNIKNYKKRFNL